MPGIIQIDDINEAQALIGNNDEHLKAIEEGFDVIVHARGQEIAVRGTQIEHVEQAESVLINLLKVIQQGVSISLKDVEAAIKMAKRVRFNTYLIYMMMKLLKMHSARQLEPKRWGNVYMLMQCIIMI